MALSNHERVGKAMELLKTGLAPFIEREVNARFKEKSSTELLRYVGDDRINAQKRLVDWDVAALLRLMWEAWNEIFHDTLGRAERSLVSELRTARNRWAHQEPFSLDDAYRALDSSVRLLAAIAAPQADELEKMKTELLRVRFDDQARREKRKSTSVPIVSGGATTLKPWREVIIPHKDVASGRYQQAEFAADLWQVHRGEGSDEYRLPVEFFRRTFLTESLKRLLVSAAQRINGVGGDPVVQLQTNFGGGKTHSMLALYHLFSGAPYGEFLGIDEIVNASGVTKLPQVKRVVLVGNKISAGNPHAKPDGTIVRTLWGELAWQLGGKKAFERVKADDEHATNPGDTLRELFKEYGPCLILIDEWVAYARQLHDQGDLPAGSFETQFTFAQALTESAKLVKDCLLVISLPASDTSESLHTRADDAEVGGQRGREALDRLRNVIGRVESSWRPASAEEGFEIVRRRLFEPMVENKQFVSRDWVVKEFYNVYFSQQAEFPPECRSPDYEKRMKAAYPIHPEIFDRLYGDWSTLVKFQRTRGVLRLMAAVIHSLWEGGDKNPLILPSNLPIGDSRVQFELTRYLPDNWPPVIEKDVDGPNSLPLRLDGEIANLGKFRACLRVARTIYLGSAPMAGAANRGLEDRRIKLGCVMPGESPAIFGDAMRRLTGAATYLYQDGPRYWYSTQPTVTKLADDRAEQLKREPDKVAHELEQRVRADLRKMGDFNRIHAMPHSGQDVPDDLDAGLVVLGVEQPYGKEPGCAAEMAAKAILDARGHAPRRYRNTLVFLAADKTRLHDLDEAARKFLAWESILAEQEVLNLDPQQVKQAEIQKGSADGAVTARIPETYQWLLVPAQTSPHAAVEWQAYKLSGNEALAVRVSKKLRNDELLLTSFAGTRLKMELDRIPLWRGNHVAVKQLAEDFACFLYLPRLKDSSVLLGAIHNGLLLLTWQQESFAFADSFDEEKAYYRGLRNGEAHTLNDTNSPGLLVKGDIAKAQFDAASVPTAAVLTTEGKAGGSTASSVTRSKDTVSSGPGPSKDFVAPPERFYGRFHGTVTLEPARAGRDAGRVAEEVIAHLVLAGAKVNVTLEIEAEFPSGASEHVVRTVTENSRAMKFSSHGFEKE